VMYQQPQGGGAPGAGSPSGSGGGAGASGPGGASSDEVIDAEYVDVDQNR
jgi:hypothetical protein